MQDFMWWDPPKTATDGEKRKVFMERCKDLFDNLENFRLDAFRYFLIVDYKEYSGKDKTLVKDENNHENFILNPYLTLNVTSSCIETANNKIAKIKPKVTFLTEDASRETREWAGKMDHWVLKKFKKGKVWKEASKAHKSACICGLGVLKLYPENDKKKYFRFKKISVFNFFCDNAFRGAGYPDEAGEKKSFNIHKLKTMFPSKAKEIEQNHGDNLKENVTVYECFYSKRYHMIATESVILLEEKWEKPLPYHLFKWEEAEQGSVSVGIAKKLYEIQLAITYILGKTFRSVKNFAVPRIFLPKGSQPNHKTISNLVAEIVEINAPNGQMPQFSTPKAIDGQVLDILNMLWMRAFEVIGISQLSAGGQIPRGLEKASGAALRSYQQVESERFQLAREDYEEAFVRLAKLLIKFTPDGKFPKGVSKKDMMDVSDDITIWASSILPDKPAGKLAMVGDLFNTGLVTGNQALSLMKSPDVSKFISSETARMNAIDLLLARSIKNNEKPQYHPELGLELFLDRARKLFAELIVDEGNNVSINLLKNCIKELQDKVSEQTGIQNTLNQLSGPGGAPQSNSQSTNIGQIAGQN